MAEFEALIDGYRRFRQQIYSSQRERYDTLTHKGQAPGVMVIACCDSRVDPTIIFDADPGELFVLRNVANLVPPYEPTSPYGAASAAIEFAVTQLKVRHIVVLGHAQCGGIRASITGDFDGVGQGHDGPSFIGKWMAMIRPERDKVLEAHAISPDMDPQRTLEQAAIRRSLANLMTFPFVESAVADGSLSLEGAYFGIADGILHVLNGGTDRFEPVTLDWSVQAA